ncbi:hypothetical protein BDW68DRAFT_192356 [Aspergillus falconensis]
MGSLLGPPTEIKAATRRCLRPSREIADSEKFRHSIKEIVWDDARLLNGPLQTPIWTDLPSAAAQGRSPHSCPSYICWQYYQNLVQQQEDVIIFNKDADAMAYGLPRFPALERITVTPAAHGWIFAPLRETPMIRAFPRGFNYSMPPEATKQRFRGFCIVTRAVAQCSKHHVSQLIVDVNSLETGLNCRVFEGANPESGLLHTAIRQAENQQQISLRTNLESDQAADGAECGVSGGSRAQFVSLRTVFPGFSSIRDDLVSFLAAGLATLRSVHLSFLYFVDQGGCWSALLSDMRANLNWRARHPFLRLRVEIGTELWFTPMDTGFGVWIGCEV